MTRIGKTGRTAALATLVLASGVIGHAIGGGMASAAPADATALGCSARQIEANKQLAYLFDMKRDWRDAYDKMAPDYIQHNPMAKRIGKVNGVSGRDEFKLLLEMKDKGFGGPPPAPPGQPAEDTYHYVMANCDHVFLLKKQYLPDPLHKGQFYEAFDFDLWRVADGKLVEHWDGARIPQNVPPILTKPIAELAPPAGGPPPAPPR